jgi:catechol 2,3-dioxygenase-like lactoylglutathione lyase family enzyme
MPDIASSTVASPRASLGGVTPILRVESVDASVSYYIEQLGFSLQWRNGTVASVARDRTSLMLCEGDQGHAGTWVWIAATDVDSLYAELRDRGARLRHEPANYPWGSRECQVTDPDGHVLRFGADLRPGEPFGDWVDGHGIRWFPQPDGQWRAAEQE